MSKTNNNGTPTAVWNTESFREWVVEEWTHCDLRIIRFGAESRRLLPIAVAAAKQDAAAASGGSNEDWAALIEFALVQDGLTKAISLRAKLEPANTAIACGFDLNEQNCGAVVEEFQRDQQFWLELAQAGGHLAGVE